MQVETTKKENSKMSDNTKLIEAIKDADNAIVKALNTLKAIASERHGSAKI